MNLLLMIFFIFQMNVIFTQDNPNTLQSVETVHKAEQSKNNNLFFAFDIFSQIDLIMLFNEMFDSKPAFMSGINFRFGVKKAYWYNQLRISTLLPSYTTKIDNMVYGRRVGFLTGVGGIVKETKFISMYVDFGVGLDLSFDKYLDETKEDQYGNQSFISVPKYSIVVELSWSTTMFISEKTQFIIGLHIGEIILVDPNATLYDPNTTFGLRTGLSLGVQF